MILRAVHLVFIVTLSFATPVHAKLIAIIFDTSGSMEPRYRLPTFGMQLLAATVDGRAGFDRLMLMTFDEYGERWGLTIPDDSNFEQIAGSIPDAITYMELSNPAQHQSLVTGLAPRFAFNGSAGTPYGPIEVMLDAISGRIKEGEEAYLVIVSDGAYHATELDPDGTEFMAVKTKAAMRDVFSTYKSRIDAKNATLNVEYLFIDSTQGQNRSLVQRQGVRDTLLAAFNGPAASTGAALPGSWYVSSERELWESLKDIIARVSATDRRAQSEFVTYSNNKILIDSPLSISRVVIVSTAPQGQSPAKMTENSFDVAQSDERVLEASMTAGDIALGAQPRTGRVQHLWFLNPISAREHEVIFDRSVSEDVFLLFETQSVANLKITGSDGHEINPERDGSYRLFVDETYGFFSQILDGDDQSLSIVDMSTLPDQLAMTLTLTGASAPGTRSMDIERAENRGVFNWTPQVKGRLSARSRATMPGFPSPESNILDIVVLDSQASLTVSDITPAETCTSCTQGEIGSSIQPDETDVKIGSFDVTSTADIDGAISFANTDIPAWMEIRDQNGNVIDKDAEIPFAAGENRTYTVWRTGRSDDGTISSKAQEVAVNVKPAGAWAGKAINVPAQIRLQAPDLTMKLAFVSQPKTPGALDGLVVPDGELVRGAFSAQYSLLDILDAPDPDRTEDLVTIAYDGALSPLVHFEASFSDPTATGFHALEIRPSTSYWCLCAIGISNLVRGTDGRDVSVRYFDDRTGQTASAILAMFLPVSRIPLTLSCLLNALVLLIAAMLIRAIIALFTMEKFPRTATAEIIESDGGSISTFKKLRKGSRVYWMTLFSLFLGNPTDTTNVRGLRLTAVRKGARVDLAKTAPPWESEFHGETFVEFKDYKPSAKWRDISWNDTLTNTDNKKLSVKFRKRRSD